MTAFIFTIIHDLFTRGLDVGGDTQRSLRTLSPPPPTGIDSMKMSEYKRKKWQCKSTLDESDERMTPSIPHEVVLVEIKQVVEDLARCPVPVSF